MSFRYRTPVRFSDVDHAGIVYYPVFYHYFHMTFEEFFRDRMSPTAYVELLDVRRIGFPAVHTECDFSGPLRFGDDVEIEMTVERVGGKSITFAYTASRMPANTPAARGKVVCAVTNLDTFRAVEVPEDLRELLLAIRNSPSS